MTVLAPTCSERLKRSVTIVDGSIEDAYVCVCVCVYREREREKEYTYPEIAYIESENISRIEPLMV